MVKEEVVSCRVRQIQRRASAPEQLDAGATRFRAMNLRSKMPSSKRIQVDTETTKKVSLKNPRDVVSGVELSSQFMSCANMNHEVRRGNNSFPHPVTPYHGAASKRKEPRSRRRQGSPCEVPPVIYARVPSAECPLITRDDIRPLTGVDASISTVSSSNSSSLDVSDEENAMSENVLKEKTATPFRDSKQQSAACPIESTSSQLNPNADEFVPSTNGLMPSTRRNTIAIENRRTSLKPRRTGGQRILRCFTRFPSPRVHVPASIDSIPDLIGSSHRFPMMSRSQPKITALSTALKIFVVDLLSEDECNWILHHTEQHVVNSVPTGTETWRKLFTHTQFDLPCCEVLPLRPMTNELLIQIRKIIGDLFKARRGASRLAPRSWKEPHLLRYQKVAGKPEHTGMIMHFDGGHMTWQLMLSDHETEYTGKLS